MSCVTTFTSFRWFICPTKERVASVRRSQVRLESSRPVGLLGESQQFVVFGFGLPQGRKAGTSGTREIHQQARLGGFEEKHLVQQRHLSGHVRAELCGWFVVRSKSGGGSKWLWPNDSKHLVNPLLILWGRGLRIEKTDG